MKSTTKRLFSLVLTFIVIFSFSIPAFAESDDDANIRASDYITSVYAHTSISNGMVYVNYSITGTGTMNSIGATAIMVFKSNNVGVTYLDSSNTSGLMGSNTFYYSNTISCCSAQSGEHYYAIVLYRAEDSTGYDTTSYTTPWTPWVS